MGPAGSVVNKLVNELAGKVLGSGSPTVTSEEVGSEPKETGGATTFTFKVTVCELVTPLTVTDPTTL